MPTYLQKGPTLSLPANKTTQTNVTFGIGNGSDVNFTVIPPTGFSSVYVSTIYRTDWQGTVALYATARTNKCPKSTNIAGWSLSGLSSSGATTTAPDGSNTCQIIYETATTAAHFAQIACGSCAVGDTLTYRVRLAANGREWARVTIYSGAIKSVYVNLLTGDVGTVSSGVTYQVSAAPDGFWEVTISIVAGDTTPYASVYNAVADLSVTYLGEVSRGVLVWGAHLSVASMANIGSYIPTTSAPVTLTDYTVSGLTYTLAETPVTGAILSYTGYSYTAAYATFDIPTCGSISISPSGLTSGKLRITASVDGTNFNPAVILPIDEATGILATSSDLPNGLYALNVKPFKAVRFTQTNVTDTVTISTALGR